MNTGSGDRSALVLYGTETGTSQDLAEELGQILERYHFRTQVLGLDSVNPGILSSFSLTVFAISTTGQGDFPSNAKRFWTALLRRKLDANFLKGVKYALIGLGDSSYPKFNWAARKLEKRLHQLGATEILESCEADEQGEDSTEGAFLAWCLSFKNAVLEQFPLPHGEQPLPEDTTLPSKRTLELISSVSDDQQTIGSEGVAARPFPSTEPDVDSRLLPGSVQATLESNSRITPNDHWQDVRHLTLTLDQPMPYLPGDALAIMPKNFHQDVTSLLELMGWSELADRPITVKQTDSLWDPNAGSSALDVPTTLTTLRSLLADYLDITAIPKRSFFGKIARYTSNEMHRERLLEFTEAQYLDEYYDYATRPRRSIIEILQEFDTIKLPWQEAINIFPVMRPRQFSIASGGGLKRNADGTARFDLLVAIVKYRTVIKKIRQGVCTRYIAALLPGSRLKVTLRNEGRIHSRPQDFTGAHILIGAGTGIAPLRAILYEKYLISKKLGTVGLSRLIFGCRSRSADYFFANEWQAFCSSEQEGTFQMETAFSRDQQRKVYVQDRIREQAEGLFEQLYQRRATVVVCGSSGAMPKAVREAILDVLDIGFKKDDGAMTESRSAAEAYLEEMEKSGRFRQETW